VNTAGFRYVYGPVHSRRLGRSLGVALVPFKTCTDDCLYCQLGRTTCKTTERREYVPVADLLAEVERKLAHGPAPDLVTLAGSGEPTLHSGIGDLLAQIKRRTSIPVAVLTNGSLLWMTEVQDALAEADLVMPSLDAGDDPAFQRVNRPHPAIGFEKMVEGLIAFRERFRKPVWLEVFLLAGITGRAAEVEGIAAIVKRIRPDRVQLNTVARPPAEESVRAVWPDQMAALTCLFDPPAEVISGEQAAASQPASSAAGTDRDILALLSRRPCTAQGVSAGLGLHIADTTKRLQSLLERKQISTLRRNGVLFYMTPPASHSALDSSQ
jgi:wyosine [tRNA(Phe)-imidazoG37] synthetase (radical SAM superfamily)